jgi:glycine oxidase
VLADGERVEADVVLVCAGAWARKLGGLPRGVAPHVRPMRGQMFSVEMTRLASLSRVVRAPDAYLVPKSDGRLIVGATMEDVGFDDRLTAGGLFELLRGAWEAFPGVYDLPIVETWTGFRPMTLSREPVLGPSPQVDGLWFATGHGRNGILLAPLTADLVAEGVHTGAVPARIRGFGVR